MLSKRKTLDEGSLLSRKSKTHNDHKFTSTPYVPTDPGIGPLFNSLCVQKGVGVCVHQMNKYLSHAYISKNTLKASKSYIRERKRNKRKPTKEEVMILHEIRSPNSLKTVPSGVANYRNLPFDGRATRGSRVRLPREEGTRSRHQRLFEENIGKTGKVWSTNFNRERFGSCFYARGRY